MYLPNLVVAQREGGGGGGRGNFMSQLLLGLPTPQTRIKF